MKCNRHIIFNKAIACFFLAVLAFVYAEKSFHTHNTADFATAKNGITLTAENNTCSVCAFQLAKDGNIPVPVSFEIQLVLPENNFAIFQAVHSFSSFNLMTSRGPPAC